MLSWNEIRERAFKFSKDWEDARHERAESQLFWNDFFTVFGVPLRRVATFEKPVKMLDDHTGFIDLLWKGTLIVEHKSRDTGKNLDRAYVQIKDYFPALKDYELPRYALVSNFDRFRLYDLDENSIHEFRLKDFPQHIHHFGFMAGYSTAKPRDEVPVNREAAEQMAALHDALSESGYTGHPLEVFLVRILFCLFADGTGIFNKGAFAEYVQRNTREDGMDTGMQLSFLFQILNTPEDKRQNNLDEITARFPYVNGDLFSEALPLPSFDRTSRDWLLRCCYFNWSKVSPVIFGSMFQAVMNPKLRRNIGAHYTSEKNVLKIVSDLFLNELREEFERIKNNVSRLKEFHTKLASLKFFDPACGCGDFLIITYRELRLLELDVLKRLDEFKTKHKDQLLLDTLILSKVNVDCLFGIEIEDFPCQVAKVAIWLTDHQMNMAVSEAFGQLYVRLPLRTAPSVIKGNALALDWNFVAPKSQVTCVLGNPPYVGKQFRSEEQQQDMATICGRIKGFATLDYVAAWYAKAADYIQGTDIKVAFVASNSITQGEQVGILWQHMLARGVKINFAHRTFRWSNEGRGQAAVFCVIIGFSLHENNTCMLYDYATPESEASRLEVRHINPYLVDAVDALIISRTNPICDVAKIKFGSMPNDGGHLILSTEEYTQLIRDDPGTKIFIRKFLGADEFLNGIERYCLWLKESSPAELHKHPAIMKRVQECAAYRADSKRATTRELADTPFLFGEDRQPERDYLLIPSVSSERRHYIPMGFFPPTVIASNLNLTISGASLFEFGVLSSAMHMAWMRQVCGRLKGDYRYSNKIVYNNFPWPENLKDEHRKRVEDFAQLVLDARAKWPDSTLAQLYDPRTMPKPLLDVHRSLDAAVDKCYRSTAFKSELERLEFLFLLYRKYTEPMNLTEPTGAKIRKTRLTKK